jgi:hypothetical protein
MYICKHIYVCITVQLCIVDMSISPMLVCLYVQAQTVSISLISGFRRDVDEIYALLGYYAVSCGNFLPTFQDRYIVPKRRYTITTRRRVISQKSAALCIHIILHVSFFLTTTNPVESQ